MSLNRYAKQRDITEAPIVQALEQAGFQVFKLDKPCDLLVRKPSDPPGRFQALEVKTVRKKSGVHKNRSRKTLRDLQEAFLAQTLTPVVVTPAEALAAVGVFFGGEP